MNKFRWDRLLGVFGVAVGLCLVLWVIPLVIGYCEVWFLKWDWFEPNAIYAQGLLSLLVVSGIVTIIILLWISIILPIIEWFFEDK